MEDENKVKNTIKILKIILLLAVIIAAVGYIVFSSQRNKNFTNLTDYLMDNGYKENEDDVLTKEEQKQVDNTTENINYVYSIEANKFTKEMINNSPESKEQITLLYDGTNNLDISYYYEQYSTTSSQNYIMHSATYNINTKKFDCSIISNTQNIETKCPQIKAYAEQFSKEINKIIDESGVNTFFSPKDSKKW